MDENVHERLQWLENELHGRVYWLEKKIVEILWAVVSVVSMYIAFEVGKYSDTRGWEYFGVVAFTGVWVGLIAKRYAFKDLPKHIDPLA
jgi:hypothetical protein